MPKKSTYIYLSSRQRSWRSPKWPFVSQGTDLTAGGAQKALLAGYMPPAHAKRLTAVQIAFYLLHSSPMLRS